MAVDDIRSFLTAGTRHHHPVAPRIVQDKDLALRFVFHPESHLSGPPRAKTMPVIQILEPVPTGLGPHNGPFHV